MSNDAWPVRDHDVNYPACSGCKISTWHGQQNGDDKVSKMKTNRGAAKRFRRTGKGGFKRAQSHLNHILTKKKSKRKRQLGTTQQVAESDVKSVRRMLPYS